MDRTVPAMIWSLVGASSLCEYKFLGAGVQNEERISYEERLEPLLGAEGGENNKGPATSQGEIQGSPHTTVLFTVQARKPAPSTAH